MIKIGILNLIEHLDETVEGFKNALEQSDIYPQYFYFNARGNKHKLAVYSKKILKEKVDLVFACSTPSAITIRDNMKDNNIPVVYGPVFNPHLSNLVNPEDIILQNFTGVSGMISPFHKVSIMIKVFSSLSNITIFNEYNEPNSVFETENLVKAIVHNNLQYEIISLPEGKVSLNMLDKINNPVLLAFSMKIEENLEQWIDTAIDHEIPVIASSKRGAVLGCLAGLYADHYKIGVMAGHKAKSILSGTPPYKIDISYPDECKIVCNYRTSTMFNFDFPIEISTIADIC